jgi:hypothetical protein
VCVVPESKKLDDTLKVYNSSSLLEMDAGAAPGRSGGLAGAVLRNVRVSPVQPQPQYHGTDSNTKTRQNRDHLYSCTKCAIDTRNLRLLIMQLLSSRGRGSYVTPMPQHTANATLSRHIRG